MGLEIREGAERFPIRFPISAQESFAVSSTFLDPLSDEFGINGAVFPFVAADHEIFHALEIEAAFLDHLGNAGIEKLHDDVEN